VAIVGLLTGTPAPALSRGSGRGRPRRRGWSAP
jgi:hypothetical protein